MDFSHLAKIEMSVIVSGILYDIPFDTYNICVCQHFDDDESLDIKAGDYTVEIYWPEGSDFDSVEGEFSTLVEAVKAGIDYMEKLTADTAK